MGEAPQVRDVAPEEAVPRRGAIRANLGEEIGGGLEILVFGRIVMAGRIFVSGRIVVMGSGIAQGAPLLALSEEQPRRATALAEQGGAPPTP